MTSPTWHISADRETQIPVITITGPLTLPDFKEHLEETHRHPLYQHSDRCLWELRGVSNLPPAGVIRALAAYVKSSNVSKGRMEALLVSTDAQFGLARMFEMLSEEPGITRRVFRYPDQAWHWLLGTGEQDERIFIPTAASG
jgi:hypothetical protein